MLKYKYYKKRTYWFGYSDHEVKIVTLIKIQKTFGLQTYLAMGNLLNAAAELKLRSLWKVLFLSKRNIRIRKLGLNAL
jgi:hypothetical protein